MPTKILFFERTDWRRNYAQFEEGGLLTKTRNYAESCDKSDSESLMMNKQDMDAINSGDESYHDLIST